MFTEFRSLITLITVLKGNLIGISLELKTSLNPKQKEGVKDGGSKKNVKRKIRRCTKMQRSKNVRN